MMDVAFELGAIHLIRCGLLDACSPEATWDARAVTVLAALGLVSSASPPESGAAATLNADG